MLESYLQLAVYVPEIRHRYRRRLQRAPFFPGYLFIQANLQEVKLSSINTTPGVVRLVSFGGAPQPIPDAAIEAIREAVARFNGQGGKLEHDFQLGETVLLRDGPLQGLMAVFAGPMRPSERVRVLINFLGGHWQAEVNVGLIEHVEAKPLEKRERRTRGHGRKIRK